MKSTLRWRTPWNRTTTSRNCTTTETHRGEQTPTGHNHSRSHIKTSLKFCKNKLEKRWHSVKKKKVSNLIIYNWTCSTHWSNISWFIHRHSAQNLFISLQQTHADFTRWWRSQVYFWLRRRNRNGRHLKFMSVITDKKHYNLESVMCFSCVHFCRKAWDELEMLIFFNIM